MYIHRYFSDHKYHRQWPVRNAQLERGRDFVVTWFHKKGVRHSLWPVVKYFEKYLKGNENGLLDALRYSNYGVCTPSDTSLSFVLENLCQEFWIKSFLRDSDRSEILQSVCDDVRSIMWNDEAFRFCYERDYLCFIRMFLSPYVTEEDFDARCDRFHILEKERAIEAKSIKGLFMMGKQKYLPYECCQEPWFIEAVQDVMVDYHNIKFQSHDFYHITKVIEYGNIPIPWSWYMNVKSPYNYFFELDYAMKHSQHHELIKTLYNDEYVSMSDLAHGFRTGELVWASEPVPECSLIL